MAEKGLFMNRNLVVLLACSALFGCHRNSAPAAPTGQVAATAAGKEITAADVRLELGPLANDPQAAAKQQSAALQAIINRKLLAAAAVDHGIDKSPVGAMLLQKARELALISMLQQGIQSQVPKASDDEANTYIQEHPASFAQRRLITVDQLIIPQIPPAILKATQPLDTMEQITALLDSNKIPYHHGGAVIDPATVDPAAAKQIAQLKVGSVFVTPAGGGATVSRIKDAQPEPLTGPAAVRLAKDILYSQRVQGQVNSQFESILKAGQSTVKINPNFQTKSAAGAGTAK